jgi:DNA-binding NtrC family response regulator
MSIRILVAEDEEIMRITVIDSLRAQGWQVDAAETGSQALDTGRIGGIDTAVSKTRNIDPHITRDRKHTGRLCKRINCKQDHRI